MSENRYYWIKTKRDVFNGQDESAAYLLTLEHGAEYFCIFQNIAVIAADKDGVLAFSVKGELKPYSDDYIADRCFLFDKERVKEALKVLIEIGYIERGKDSILRVQNIDDIVGNETAAAVKMRNWRRGKNKEDGKQKQECNQECNQDESCNESCNEGYNVTENETKNETALKDKSTEYRVQSTENRVQSTESNKDNVNRTPLYPPKGSGAGAESVENEREEAFLSEESGEEYGNIDDYPVSTEEPPEIDYDHMTPYQQFVFDWNIRNDVDNYDAGSVANIDWAAMYDEVERSPSFLQKRTARGLKFFIGISDKILRGDYRDDNNLTTAEEIYARSGRQQKKAFRHIQRKNDVLRSDPWKEQAN